MHPVIHTASAQAHQRRGSSIPSRPSWMHPRPTSQGQGAGLSKADEIPLPSSLVQGDLQSPLSFLDAHQDGLHWTRPLHTAHACWNVAEAMETLGRLLTPAAPRVCSVFGTATDLRIPPWQEADSADGAPSGQADHTAAATGAPLEDQPLGAAAHSMEGRLSTRDWQMLRQLWEGQATTRQTRSELSSRPRPSSTTCPHQPNHPSF